MHFHIRRPLTRAVFERVSYREQQLCAAARQSGVLLDTDFSDTALEINGVADKACMPLVLKVGHHHPFTTTIDDALNEFDSSVHTRNYPYDAVVAAVLTVVGHELRSEYGRDARGIDVMEIHHDEGNSWFRHLANKTFKLMLSDTTISPEDRAYWVTVSKIVDDLPPLPHDADELDQAFNDARALADTDVDAGMAALRSVLEVHLCQQLHHRDQTPVFGEWVGNSLGFLGFCGGYHPWVFKEYSVPKLGPYRKWMLTELLNRAASGSPVRGMIQAVLDQGAIRDDDGALFAALLAEFPSRKAPGDHQLRDDHPGFGRLLCPFGDAAP